MPDHAVLDPLLRAAALAACFCGTAWLALAMEVHWRQVRGPRPPAAGTVRWLRTLGVVSLAGSLGLSLALDHPSMAVLVWVMMIAASALGMALLLAWRPGWVGWLAGRA